MQYVGADGARRPRDLSRWAVQPKIDGIYCEATTDATGRIVEARTRTGLPIVETDIVGLDAGLPCAILVGELEAQTPWGVEQRERQGYQRLWLFDLLAADGRDLSRLPYSSRRDVLYRARARAWEQTDDRRDARGRYSVGAGHRRLPIVAQYPAVEGDRVYDEVVEEGGEGIVYVSLDAPAGKRGAKVKRKRRDTIDALIVVVERTRLGCDWQGQLVIVARPRRTLARVGQVAELAHQGWYRDGLPRHARLVGLRLDLSTSVAVAA